MGKSIGKVDIVTKDGDVNLYVLAGQLHQVSKDAIAKEMKKLSETFCYDEAYWTSNLTLELSELGCNFDKLRTVVIADKDIEEESKCNCIKSDWMNSINDGSKDRARNGT